MVPKMDGQGWMASPRSCQVTGLREPLFLKEYQETPDSREEGDPRLVLTASAGKHRAGERGCAVLSVSWWGPWKHSGCVMALTGRGPRGAWKVEVSQCWQHMEQNKEPPYSPSQGLAASSIS